MNTDTVDRILANWRQERPDLDVTPMALYARLVRLADYLAREFEPVYARFGLGGGRFDVLASLRRSGAPYQQTPTALSRLLLLSSGGMTHRLDQLEAAGLIARLQDPNDRRGTLVQLTDSGRDMIDRALEAHVDHLHRVFDDALAPADRNTLAELLRALLLALEPTGRSATT
jgi:DNA-binding MarR family transcriptional regulator